MRRVLLALLLGAGVVAGFGSGFASLHHGGGWHGGWSHGGCPSAESPAP